MKVISIFMPIGGTGKSTIALNLAERLAYQTFKRVWLIDLDPQMTLTSRMERSAEYSDANSIAAWLYETGYIKPLIHHNIITILGSPFISKLNDGGSAVEIARTLQNRLSRLENKIDVCIIDTNPGLTPLSLAALMVSNAFVLPLEYSARGTDAIRNLIQGNASFLNKFAVAIPNRVMNGPGFEEEQVSLQAELLRNRITSVGLPDSLMIHRCGDEGIPFTHMGTYGGFHTRTQNSLLAIMDQICFEVMGAAGLAKHVQE
jgi:cellulose biosynthesis protein BcsQ